ERRYAARRLGRGGQPRARAAALEVEGPERRLRRQGEADALALEGDAGPAGGGDADGPAEGGADGRGHRRDLVLGLEGPHSPALVERQLLENARGGRGRGRPQHDGDLRALPRGRAAPR